MKEDKPLSPIRPYLLRAHYDWLCDNQLTPHLVVNTNYPNVDVPFEYAKDGQIVLNIAPHALGNLLIGNDLVSFSASFNGKPRHLSIPIGAVIAIYARENNAGIGFAPEPFYEAQIKEAESRQSIALVSNESDSEQIEASVEKSNHDKMNDLSDPTDKQVKQKASSDKLATTQASVEKKKTKKTSHLRIID